MDESIEWEAVGRYFAGESSPAEADAVRRWLAERPVEAALLQALDGATRGVELTPLDDAHVERALRAVKGRRAAGVMPLEATRGRRRWVLSTVAAAGILALAAGSGLWLRRSGRSGGAGLSVGPSRVLATATGQIDSLRLADGTRIVLGPESRVEIGAGYGGARRDVRLEGQALFDVRHDAARPFTVHVDGASIADIGTRFTARSDAPSGVRVAVLAGAVRLRRATGSMRAAGDSGVVLAAGDRGVLSPGGYALAVRGSATEEDLAWTTGRLAFRDAPLSAVATDLRRWYGVQLQFADSALSRRRVTASFATQPIDSVLNVLELTLGSVRMQRQGDTVRVRRLTTAVPAR